MIDQLLEAKKITQKEHDTYMIFGFPESIASKWYKDEWLALNKKPWHAINENSIIFIEGQRTVFKRIQFIIEKVDELIELKQKGNESDENDNEIEYI